MAERNSGRSVLGDVTNRLDKRGISEFAEKDNVKRLRPCTGINSLKGNVISSISKIPNQIRVPDKVLDFKGSLIIDLESDECSRFENVNSGGNVVDLTENDSVIAPLIVDVETREGLGECFGDNTSRTMSETGDDDEKTCDVDEVMASLIYTQTDEDDHNADNLVMSQTGSVDCALLPSQESRVFGTEKSVEKKKEDGCVNMNLDADSIKACSCSFCTKAAYIWLDLNYQDIKARVSAMKKSQKEATILAERSCRNKTIEKHGGESSTRVPNLESNLRHQWRYLFQHMAGIWEGESNQLEASLLPLSDLREKTKNELELIKAAAFTEKH